MLPWQQQMLHGGYYLRARPGPIEFCLLDQALPGEVTINAGEDFPLNPQIKGALKSLDGVLQVEEI